MSQSYKISDELLTDTITWSGAKRHVRQFRNTLHVFLSETFRVEPIRIGEEGWIALNGVHGNEDMSSFVYSDVSAGKTVVVFAVAIQEG